MNFNDAYNALSDWHAAQKVLTEARADEERQRKLLEAAATKTAQLEAQLSRMENRVRGVLDGKDIAPVAIAGLS